MNDEDALLQLYAGSKEDQDGALECLYERYYAKLVEAVVRHRIDVHDAYAGAATALHELYRDAAKVVPKLEGRSEQPWRWLVDRAVSRSVDERRRNRRLVKEVPKAQQPTFRRQDFPTDDSDVPLRASDTTDPVGAAQHSEMLERARAAAIEFLENLDGDERGILLHDLVFRYELLSRQEAEEFDEELIGRSHPDGIYTDEALEKRRQRVTKKLRTFFETRGIK